MDKLIIGIIIAFVLFLAFWGCCELSWIAKGEFKKLKLRRRRKARGIRE